MTSATHRPIRAPAVPLILATAFIFCAYLDLTQYLPRGFENISLNLGHVAAAFYALRYMYFSPNVLGLSAAALVFVLFGLSMAFIDAYGSSAWAPALVLHVIGWCAQIFVGHAIYERRAPALLDNLQQVSICLRLRTLLSHCIHCTFCDSKALIAAPFFVYIEGLMALGLVPHLTAIVDPLIKEEIARFRQQKQGASAH